MDGSSNDIRENQFNLQGLLRFALNYTKSEDAKNQSSFEAMDSERKKFLEAALKSMTVDVIKEFEIAIATLEDASKDESEKISALNVIRDYIDNIDFANNFLKVGGADILIKYLSNPHPKLCANSLYAVAEISQNNPFAQKLFLDKGILPQIVQNIESTNEEISSSAIHTLSALVRHYEPALVEFLKMGGVSVMLRCLKTHRSKVFVKSCFLLATLSADSPEIRDEFVKKAAIAEISASLDVIRGFDVRIETALYALSELSKSPDWNPEEDFKVEFISILNQLKDENLNLPESEEIVNYIKIILDNISNPSGRQASFEEPKAPAAIMMIKDK